MTDKKRSRNDKIVIIALIILPLVFLLASLLHGNNRQADIVYVEVNNERYGTFLLSADQEIVLDVENGHNVIIIKDGHVKMTEANCKDQVCVLTKEISRHGEQIICLPNKVVIEIISSEDSDIDSLSQ